MKEKIENIQTGDRYITEKRIRKLQDLTMKPSVNAENHLRHLNHEIWVDRMHGRTPKNDLAAKLTVKQRDRVAREILVEELSTLLT